jgi:tRNA 2-thiouridine synthesizing protein A
MPLVGSGGESWGKSHKNEAFAPFLKQGEKMSSVDVNSIKAANSIDARGFVCPKPLLEAKKGIEKIEIGEVLEILSNDSGTRNDLPRWAERVGHEYLGHVSMDGYDRLFIMRKK